MSATDQVIDARWKQNDGLRGGHGTMGGKIPFRGPSRLRREPLSQQAEVVRDFHVRVFSMDDEDDVERYEAVCDMIANERAKCTNIERQWMPQQESWKILMEWIEWYKEDTDKAKEKRLNMGTNINQ